MNQALQLFTTIWRKILTNMFNSFDIGGGVTIGWILLTVAVMGMLLRTILPQVTGIERSKANFEVELWKYKKTRGE